MIHFKPSAKAKIMSLKKSHLRLTRNINTFRCFKFLLMQVDFNCNLAKSQNRENLFHQNFEKKSIFKIYYIK